MRTASLDQIVNILPQTIGSYTFCCFPVVTVIRVALFRDSRHIQISEILSQMVRASNLLMQYLQNRVKRGSPHLTINTSWGSSFQSICGVNG